MVPRTQLLSAVEIEVIYVHRHTGILPDRDIETQVPLTEGV